MNITQGILHAVEEGKARILTRLLPFFAVLIVIFAMYDFRIFMGLNDAQSMDNAQLARQIERGKGYTTKFIRPAALGLMNSIAVHNAANGKPGELFPADKYPKGTQRTLPDTYNPPGYPYLLAGWFKVLNIKFDQTAKEIAQAHVFPGDRCVPWLNQLFLFLTAGLTFVLGWRLFDLRVAWLAMTAFLITNLVWQYSITALPTTLITCLITAMLVVVVEIFGVGERSFASTDEPMWPAWLWTLLLGLLLGLTALCRLHLAVLVLPFMLFLLAMPRRNPLMAILVPVIGLGMIAPWIWSVYKLTGNPFGSNIALFHYGADNFDGNQIFCVFAEPKYEQLFKDVSGKEFMGFGWTLAHFWTMLGSNILVVFFLMSIMHSFKQARSQALRWLLVGSAGCIILVNNLGSPHPGNIDSWNNLILLLPGILVVGSAFFFIQLDRLHLPLWLLNNTIVIALLFFVGCPLIGNLLDYRANRPYPPYSPPALRAIGSYLKDDDWVTTDLPWASAWYGDHTSLWLPDTLNDFNEIYDNYNQSGLLVLTPVSLGAPVTTFTSGEYKDWMPFISNGIIPEHFPLNAHAPSGSGMIEYLIFGRRGGG